MSGRWGAHVGHGRCDHDRVPRTDPAIRRWSRIRSLPLALRSAWCPRSEKGQGGAGCDAGSPPREATPAAAWSHTPNRHGFPEGDARGASCGHAGTRILSSPPDSTPLAWMGPCLALTASSISPFPMLMTDAMGMASYRPFQLPNSPPTFTGSSCSWIPRRRGRSTRAPAGTEDAGAVRGWAVVGDHLWASLPRRVVPLGQIGVHCQNELPSAH